MFNFDKSKLLSFAAEQSQRAEVIAEKLFLTLSRPLAVFSGWLVNLESEHLDQMRRFQSQRDEFILSHIEIVRMEDEGGPVFPVL